MARSSKNRRYRVVVKSRPGGTERRPGFCQRHFWILAFGVILVSIGTRTFDFSLTPPSYNGLFISRPYCGLHSWAGLDGLRPGFAEYLASAGGCRKGFLDGIYTNSSILFLSSVSIRVNPCLSVVFRIS